MLFMERMKKIELLVLKRDVDEVMRYLGFAGCLQLIVDRPDQTEPAPSEREIAELRIKVEALARFLDMPQQYAADRVGAVRPREVLTKMAEAIIVETAQLVAEESGLVQQRLNLTRSIEELSAFSELTVPIGELAHLTYLAFRLGVVPTEKVEELTRELSGRAIIVTLKKPGHIVAIASRKSRFVLDSELAKFDFHSLEIRPAF